MKHRLAQVNPYRVYFRETSPFSALYTSTLQRILRRTIPLAFLQGLSGPSKVTSATRAFSIRVQ